MKCLIIGNSHASTVQLALREGWSQPGLELDIIVIPGQTQPAMQIVDGRIRPEDRIVSARSNIDPLPPEGLALVNYEGIWLVGFGLSGPSVATLNERTHLFSTACSGLSSEVTQVPHVSREVMKRMIAARLAKTGFMPLLQTLATTKTTGVRIIPRPRMSGKILRAAETELFSLYGDQIEAAISTYFTLHDEVVESLVGTIAPILWQSNETIDGLFTSAHFTQPVDFLHMNSAYGRIVLDQLAASMQI